MHANNWVQLQVDEILAQYPAFMKISISLDRKMAYNVAAPINETNK